MAVTETLTITLPTELASDLRDAIATGAYASSSEVVHEALRDWRAKRAARAEKLAWLRAEIAKGMADVEAGRLVDFDPERIVARGKARSARRSPSV